MKLRPSLINQLSEFLFRCTKKDANYDIAKAILARANEIENVKIEEISTAANTTDATVTKFCRRLGYRGYTDLKTYHLDAEILNPVFQDAEPDLSLWAKETGSWLDETCKVLRNSQTEQIGRRLSQCHTVSIISGIHGFAAANLFCELMMHHNIAAFEISREADELLLKDAYRNSEMIFIISLTGKWFEENRELTDPDKTILITYVPSPDYGVQTVDLSVIENYFSDLFHSTVGLMSLFIVLDSYTALSKTGK